MAVIEDLERIMLDLVTDESQAFDVNQQQRFIAQAVKRYSRSFPQDLDATLTGDGTTILFALPSGWEHRLSAINEVEHPVGNVPRTFLSNWPELIGFVLEAGVRQIITHGFTLAAAATARVLYSAPHVVNSAGSTLPPGHEEAVATLAASVYCRALGAFYAGDRDATLLGDVTNHREKSDEYRKQSMSYFADYKRYLGLSGDDDVAVEAPFLTHADVDISGTGGCDLVWHTRRRR